jgi:chemotaxis protein methyltransferase CheR
MHDMKEYFRYLRMSPEEKAVLLDRLTTNETSFFRNGKQFSCLTAKIIPRIEEERRRGLIRSWRKGDSSPASPMTLRILCAGCSTGEEPYSIGMALLADVRYPRAWDIGILAGDLSGSCIRTAVAGYYGNERLAGIPGRYRDRFLVKTAEGAFIAEEVKKLVEFRVFNLKDFMNPPDTVGPHPEPGRFDIIFCRNVMIYFSAEAQQDLVDALHRLLAPGGYLFTGDAEPLHLYRHAFARVEDADCLVYRKGDTAPTASPVPSVCREASNSGIPLARRSGVTDPGDG